MKKASYERGGINGAAFPGLGQKSLSRVKDCNKKNESLSMASAEKTINNRYSRTMALKSTSKVMMIWCIPRVKGLRD